jgi:hypothetical protein
LLQAVRRRCPLALRLAPRQIRRPIDGSSWQGVAEEVVTALRDDLQIVVQVLANE